MKETDKNAPAFATLLQGRITRRRLLEAGVMLAPLAACSPMLLETAPATPKNLGFRPIAGSAADAVVLPDNYEYDLVVRWGDSLFASTPDLDTTKLADGALVAKGAAANQDRQFGFNSDAIHFFPLDAKATRGILCVNNEYTTHELMHASAGNTVLEFATQHPEMVALSKAAQGVSVVEVTRASGRWTMVKDSRFNRRITAETPIDIGGPARGAALMKTGADPTGTRVLGTFANCAGGETPWGTYLTCEENIQDYFGNLERLRKRAQPGPGIPDLSIIDAHNRFRMNRRTSPYAWETVDPRFDLSKEPNEAFRFGWVVEIDPQDPQRAPVKRTALGRCAHEGASPVIAKNGRVAVYMGDDDKFEFIYKFISTAKYDTQSRAANRDLLDQGTLYAARFDADGRGEWLPLVFDPRGPLNAAAGFNDQAEVLIKVRAAAHLLGATPMDRPEDVEANPVTGRIYIVCTRNENRTAASATSTYAGRQLDTGPDAANPRGANPWGHIIEIHESGDDHTALAFAWEVFLLAGDPSGGKLITDLRDVQPGKLQSADAYYAGYAKLEDLSPIGSPDNIGFDRAGNLWIVSDGPQPHATNNGCWVCPTAGPERGRLQQFMSAPIGAEVCGCQFSPDGETLFISIQHPGEGGTVEAPRSRWPDGPGTQPRPSVIAIRKKGGGVIGS